MHPSEIVFSSYFESWSDQRRRELLILWHSVSQSVPVLNCGRKVSIHPLDLSQYRQEELFIRIDQVKNPNAPLQDVGKHDRRELSKLMCKQDYNYRLRMMTIFFSHDVNRVSVTADRALATGNAREEVEDGFSKTVLCDRIDTPKLPSGKWLASIEGPQAPSTCIPSCVEKEVISRRLRALGVTKFPSHPLLCCIVSQRSLTQ